ncbi:MAG: L,D-transpeptidase [Cyanobacteria bacterium P01_H01_bin.121]
MHSYRRHWLKSFTNQALLSVVVGVAGLFCLANPGFAEEIAAEVESLQQSDERWLQVDLSSQRLIAWEGDTPVYAVIISTGKSSTPTVTGVFAVQSKHQVARMQGYDYDVPDVPWTMYYYRGYAIHGAYWHYDFGTPVSHGCVNVALDHAEWFFNWAEVGTPVVVQH